MKKVQLTGQSEDSMEAALTDALAQASAYVSHERDVAISILEMTVMPGRGYKAVIEVGLAEMQESGPARAHIVDSADDPAPHEHFNRDRIKKTVEDYFRTLTGGCPEIPSYCLTELDMLTYLVRRAFDVAAHEAPAEAEAPPLKPEPAAQAPTAQ